MTTVNNLSDTAPQTDEDDEPTLEVVVRMYAAAKAGLALLEAVEFEEENYGASDELRVAMRAGRAAYDRLAETRQRVSG